MEETASQFVVALDIGSARTRCLIAEICGDEMRIIGRGEEPSRGVRRGEIVDLAAASYAARQAIKQAEDAAGVVVQTLFLAVGSRHSRFVNNRGCIAITREDRTVRARDIEQALAAARNIPLRDEAVKIGTLVCAFTVDDVQHVREPEGMRGTRIDAELHIITDARSSVENIVACIDPERHEIEERVFGPYAAGEAVLEADEKKLGVAMVDIGAGTTRIMVWRDNSPVFSSVVPIGGDHITSDIAMGMDLSLADAARLKEEYAHAILSQQGTIAFHKITKQGTYSFEARRLHCIVDCRLREMLDIIRRELLRAGVRPTALRMVLTGGTSKLPGIETLAHATLRCPVRLGRAKIGDTTLGPDMSVAAGLLLVGAQARKRRGSAQNENKAGKLVGWLRQLF